MATININRAAVTILSPLIDDSSKRYKTLNGADYVVLSFKHDSWVEFFPGDDITWDGVTYTIQQVPKFKKKSAIHYEYELRFEGPYYALDSAMFLLDSVEGEFFLTGEAEDFVDLIVTNLNRVHGAGSYSAGTIPTTDFKNLSFKNESCLNVLQRICEEYELEYYFSGSIVINLSTSIGVVTGLSYQYADGLRNITRSKFSNTDLITRLYAYGSERNIISTYPTKRLHLPASSYPNRYMEQNQATYGVREQVKHWDDIYPHFEGSVDSSSANNVIIDIGIDFDLNSYLIEGVTAKIVFKTGDLAGMEFEILEYNHTTHQVTFNEYTDEAGNVYPSTSFNPSAGDEFTFVDINMPAAYITAAESALATAATAYLGDMSSPNVQYEVEVDWHHLQTTSTSLDVGDLVEITDAQLAPGGINYRILQLEQSIANPYKYTIKTGEHVLVGYITRMNTSIQDVTREVRAVRRETILDTRRGYLATDELRGDVFDNDGYFDTTNIRPLSIETSMLTVGNKSTQLTLSSVLAEPNHQGNANYLDISTGDLIHFTLEASPRTWNIASYSSTSLVTGSSYYMYVRCPKVGASATWLVTTTQYQVDPDDGYYYFLVGHLSSVISDLRRISWLYGQTTVNGGFIKTGRISSIGGGTYFDLTTGNIVGTITFGAGSSGYSNITDSPDSLSDINSQEATDLADALSTANSAQTDATQALSDAAAAQSTADGKIVAYYQTTAPTGASNGDIWFDTDDGNKIYVHNGTSWVERQDDDIASAIASAQTAQTTADGKAIVFFQTSAPTSGMSEGDIWIDTNDNYKQYVYSGLAWVESTTADALQALSDAAAAQSTADGKIVAYYQDNQPSGGSEGDIWFDTNDGNRIYVYDSGSWVESQDNDIALAINNAQTAQTTADGKAVVYYQTTAPTGASAHDLWVDTNDSYKTYIYSGSAWVATSVVDAINALANAATAQSTADGKIVSFYQTSAPTTGMSHGDIWFDIDDGNKIYVYTEGYWPSFTKTTFWQTTAPTSGMVDGDIWIDTNDGNKAYEYNGTAWVLFTGTVYIQINEPTSGMSHGDLWYDSDDSNAAYIYIENEWIESQDSEIAEAIADAATAQSTADGKVTTFFLASTDPTAPPIAEGIGDLWFQTDTGKLIRWSGSSWGQDVADITQTIIDGGLITTGRIEVKNNTTTQGGLQGTTAAGSTEIGLWLGSTYANRATAPFRVTHGGAVTMTNATIKTGASDYINIDGNTFSGYAGTTLRARIEINAARGDAGELYLADDSSHSITLNPIGLMKGNTSDYLFRWDGSYVNMLNYNLVVSEDLFVGNRTAPYDTAYDRSLVVAETGTSGQSLMEIVGNVTSDSPAGRISFHNTQSSNSTKRIVLISGYRDGDNDAGKLIVHVADDSGTLRQSITASADRHTWFVGGTAELHLTSSSLSPYTHNGLDLGDSTHAWRYMYLTRLYLRGPSLTAQSYKLVYNTSTDEVTYESDASDQRLKKNLKPIDNAMEKIMQLTGYTFKFNKRGKEVTGQDNNRPRAGLVAQEVQTVLPEAVTGIGETEYLNVEYKDMTALTIQGMKELYLKIDALEERIKQLTN